MGDDAALMPYLTSANIATGAHAGDPDTMWETVALAARWGVTVGAHVAFPDRRGFGRRAWPGTPGELLPELLAQIGALTAICRSQGLAVAYVKPHGALYHAVNWERPWQALVVEVLERLGEPRAVMVQAGTPAVQWFAEAGIRVIREGFADRRYDADGRLVERRQPGAVLDPAQAAAQAVELAVAGQVATRGGGRLTLHVDSLCVHGDTPGAAAVLRTVREALEGAGVPIAPACGG